MYKYLEKKVIKKNFKLILNLGLCLILVGCALKSEYYIPVSNQVDNTYSLSKSDIIRVIITNNYLNIPSHPKSGWRNWGYFLAAKIETEKKLQSLGYNVINTGINSENDGHPTIIALVDSSKIEKSERTQNYTGISPVYTSDTELKTSPKLQGRNITLKTYYYKVTIVRPENQDNPLFQCLNSQDSNKVCIAPSNFNNYKTIFSGYSTVSTDQRIPKETLQRLISSIFYNYPNISGKKWVYFNYNKPLYDKVPKSTEKN